MITTILRGIPRSGNKERGCENKQEVVAINDGTACHMIFLLLLLLLMIEASRMLDIVADTEREGGGVRNVALLVGFVKHEAHRT
jgi:hypothetical protein